MPISQYNRSVEKNQVWGTCISCGGYAVEGKLRCVKCQNKRNEENRLRREKHSENGRCRDCGEEAQLTNRSMRGKERGNYCRDCFLKVLSTTVFGSRKHWKLLVEKLDACGWKCPYTGEELVLGDNLSFDHMDPICRFPEKRYDPDNIEPISWQINLMKRDLTKSEFLATVENIHRRLNNGC